MFEWENTITEYSYGLMVLIYVWEKKAAGTIGFLTKFSSDVTKM
jgi:hypothetical protein